MLVDSFRHSVFRTGFKLRKLGIPRSARLRRGPVRHRSETASSRRRRDRIEGRRPKDEVGIVIIGRNEGERLRRCLESVGHGGLTDGLRGFRLDG